MYGRCLSCFVALAVMLACIASSNIAIAQEPDAPDHPEARAAIIKRTGALLEALAAADAKTVASFWTANGEYIRGTDLTLRGREVIEKAYTEYLKKTPPGVVNVVSPTLRFVSDSVAIFDGTFSIKKKNPAESRESRFSILFLLE